MTFRWRDCLFCFVPLPLHPLTITVRCARTMIFNRRFRIWPHQEPWQNKRSHLRYHKSRGSRSRSPRRNLYSALFPRCSLSGAFHHSTNLGRASAPTNPLFIPFRWLISLAILPPIASRYISHQGLVLHLIRVEIFQTRDGSHLLASFSIMQLFSARLLVQK